MTFVNTVRRSAVLTALASLLSTRLPLVLIGLIAVTAVGTWPATTAEALWRVSSREIPNMLARWDTYWYLSISTDGYSWDPAVFRHANVVFFPLYPLLMRWVGALIGHHPLIAGLVVSLTCFTAAMTLLYRLAVLEFGDAGAWPVILLISTYPFAIFYSLVYTESLFLFVTVGAFYAARRNWPLLTAAFGFAAGLARPNGMWLVAPLLWMALERPAPSRVRRWCVIAAAFAPIVGTIAYSSYLFVRFGDALAWVHGQAAWGLPLALRGSAHDAPEFTRAPMQLYTDIMMWTLNIAAFSLAVFSLLPIWRRFGMPYVLWIAMNIGPPVAAHLFMSAGRFTSVLFPIFFWLATIVRPPRLWRVAGVFAAAQAGLAALFFLWYPVV